METSAKASINVEEAFFALARDIKAKMDKKLVMARSNEDESSFVRVNESWQSQISTAGNLSFTLKK